MLDKYTAHVVLMFVTWIEIVLGHKMTDYLGGDDPLSQGKLSEYIKKFEELLKTKNINDIKAEEIWKVYGKNKKQKKKEEFFFFKEKL